MAVLTVYLDMRNPTTISIARRCATLCFLLVFGYSSSGCVYRLAIQQGNLVDEEKVAQVTLGMTRNQVRFLLGTPLVDDPFNRDRWDYLYYITPSRSDTVEKRWITLYFDNNSVVRIVRDDPPEGAEDTVEGSTEA